MEFISYDELMALHKKYNSRPRYQDLLLTFEWRNKRDKILFLDNHTCQICKGRDKILDVHHTYYIKDRLPWEYPDYSLITLCKDCHEFLHERKKAARYDRERITDEPMHISDVLGHVIKKIIKNGEKVY